MEDHKAFDVRLLSESADFGDEADVQEIAVEISNRLKVVSGIFTVRHTASDKTSACHR